MKRLIPFLFLVSTAYAGTTYHKDSDWNFGLQSYHRQDVKWASEKDNKFLEFRLEGGTAGHGSGDNVKRHGAPFWERNEYTGESRMGRNNPYSVSFQFRIVKGFNGNRETFFQVHSWDQSCPLYPQLMMKFDQGKLSLHPLNDQGFHKPVYVDKHVDEVFNKWVEVRMTAEPVDKDHVKYTFDGELFNNTPVSVVATLHECSNQNLKFGIYRPGKEQGINDTSIIQFDKIQVNK
jgi:hypothetical protein